MSRVLKSKSNVFLEKKEKWLAHRYQIYSIARGFEQKFLAYFLDPGLGKTSIMLQLYKMLKLYGKTNGMLVIAPIRVCYLVWPLEIQKWSNFQNLNFNIMHGPNKNLWTHERADVHIINPDGLPWLLDQLKGVRRERWPFDMLVNDESTMFKNHKSTRFKNVKKIVPKMSRRYILTGTPIPNGYPQLFSQMQIVDEGFSLGTKIGEYRQNHFKRVGKPEWNQWELMDGEEEVINKRISNFVVRLSVDQAGIKLPKLVENKIYVELPKKAKKVYEQLNKDAFAVIDGKDVYPPTAASVKQKMHQICGGNLYEDWDQLELGKVPPAKNRPYFKLHTAKIEALKELIDELGGKPLFVAYWYHHEITELKKHFKNAVVINSKTTDKEAAKIERDWNAGKIPLLFAQPASVAHGLNFQRAGGDACWYSIIYDFELYDQFIKRLWRQGATEMVRNHFLIVRGSIDEVIYRKLHSKEDNQLDFFALMSKYQDLLTL